MQTANTVTFGQKWLDDMNTRATACKYRNGSPEINTGFYAVKKTAKGWRISNGRVWWDRPTLVEEIHAYADGTVCAHYYIEGVTTFSRRHIEEAGMRAMRASELPSMFSLSKVVYFDHQQTDPDGRITRQVFVIQETAE